MATNNILNNSTSDLTSVGTININATGSGTTTIGNSSGAALVFAANANSSISTNNQSFTLTTGTGDITISNDNTTKTMTIGSASTTQFTITSGGMTIDSNVGTTNSSLTKSGTGNLNITQSGTGSVNLIGTTVTIAGSSTPTSVEFGNSSSSITGLIGQSSVGNTSSISFDTGSGTINIGTNSIAHAVNIFNNTGRLNIFTGTGGINLPSIEVTTTSITLVPGINYVMNNNSLITATLPSGAAGNLIKICGLGSGGWKIAQLASQTINTDGHSTTTGIGGSLSSSNRYDCVELMFVSTVSLTIRSSNGTLTFV